MQTTPWMRRMTSWISESSGSSTPSFQHLLPPISIGLQSPLMLSVFLWYQYVLFEYLTAHMLTFRKLRNCLVYWALVFLAFNHSSSRSPGLEWVSLFGLHVVSFTNERQKSCSVHPWWLWSRWLVRVRNDSRPEKLCWIMTVSLPLSSSLVDSFQECVPWCVLCPLQSSTLNKRNVQVLV